MTRRNGGRLPACLLRAWTSVSQATPRNGLPPAVHEKPHCVQHNCGFQLERTGGTCGSLGLDLSGRGRPDDRMPASLMRRYYTTNSRRSSPTSGTLTNWPAEPLHLKAETCCFFAVFSCSADDVSMPICEQNSSTSDENGPLSICSSFQSQFNQRNSSARAIDNRMISSNLIWFSIGMEKGMTVCFRSANKHQQSAPCLPMRHTTSLCRRRPSEESPLLPS